MKKSNITLCLLTAMLLTTACASLKETYKSDVETPSNLFGSEGVTTNESNATSIGTLAWSDFFTDAKLQALIEKALVNNTSLKDARMKIQEAETTLASTKLEVFPTVALAPQAGYTRFDGIELKTYNIPLNVNWEPSLFSRIKNKKLQAEALKNQAADAECAVQSQLIGNIAKAYYQLIALDRELDIMKSTLQLWNKSLETQRALAQYGKAYSTSVDQMEASLLGVKAQVVDVELQIREVENAICLLLSQTPQHIDRSGWSMLQMPAGMGTGLPLDIIRNRADVRAADRVIEAAFYGEKQAKAAFYPTLSLGGTIGWTNNGLTSVDPGKILLNAVASLTQPIFMQGKLKSQLKLSQIQQEEAKNAYVQTILQAGNEVNNALAIYQKTNEKVAIYKDQIAALEKAYSGTQELMNHGKAMYLEVLTAQETLLNAQLSETLNQLNRTQAIIALYIALGGN
ncbi:MAG: TolC family protein [Prevotellaceae bacterium]|nr:TolC family protein [Prevotellaceae bacterium]